MHFLRRHYPHQVLGSSAATLLSGSSVRNLPSLNVEFSVDNHAETVKMHEGSKLKFFLTRGSNLDRSFEQG